MLGLRYVACEECGRVTATTVSATDVACGRCESDAVRELTGDDSDEAAYFASSMRPE